MSEPFDPTIDEDGLLAVSALLDGTASVEEAARVASDPELQALADELRALRDEVVAVTPPDATVRDAAVARALSVFDEVRGVTDVAHDTRPHTAASVRTGPEVVRFERRRRWYGVVTGAAAAAVAVLFVGALASGRLGGDDDDTSVAIEASADTMSDAAASKTGPTLAAEATPAAGAMTEMAADATTMADDGGADAELAESSTSSESSEDDVTAGAPGSAEISEAPAAPDATLAATDQTIAAGVDGAGTAEVVAIASPEQLRDFARSARAAPIAASGLPCVVDGAVALGEVTYQGVPAIVVRDVGAATVTAYDTRDACAVIVTVDL